MERKPDKDKACTKKSKCRKAHVSGTGSTTITIISDSSCSSSSSSSSSSSKCSSSSSSSSSCSKSKKHSKHKTKPEKPCKPCKPCSSSSSECKDNKKYYKDNIKFVNEFVKYLQCSNLKAIVDCLPKGVNLLIPDQTCIIPYAGEFSGHHKVVEAFVQFASYVSFKRIDLVNIYSNKCADSFIVRFAVDQVNRLKPAPEPSCRKLELTLELVFIFDFCDGKIDTITIVEETGPFVLFYSQLKEKKEKKCKKSKSCQNSTIIIG